MLELSADEKALEALLISMENSELIKRHENVYVITEKGKLLTERHPFSLKNACILWGLEHMDAWQKLDCTVLTGKPSFNSEKVNYFDYLADKPDKLTNYHKAMYEYAIEDYKDIGKTIDFSKCFQIMDVGGGLGALITNIKRQCPEKECFLFEKPEVIKLIPKTNITLIGGDFFRSIPKVADCIILSRVLHDWDDEKAVEILNNVFTALPQNGKLIVIENFKDKISNQASLLTLNMMAMCQSYERTKDEYSYLLNRAGFEIYTIGKLNELQYYAITKKK